MIRLLLRSGARRAVGGAALENEKPWAAQGTAQGCGFRAHPTGGRWLMLPPAHPPTPAAGNPTGQSKSRGQLSRGVARVNRKKGGGLPAEEGALGGEAGAQGGHHAPVAGEGPARGEGRL